MDSRRRVLATCAGEPADHVPLHLEVHPSYLLYDKGVATWRDQFERTEYLLSLGCDAMVEVWLPDPAFHPEVVVRTWREERPGLDAPVLVKEYDTPAGTLRQAIKETDDLYRWHRINRNTRGPLAELIDGVGLLEDVNPSRSIEFLIKGPEDLDRMRYLFQPLSGEPLDRWRQDARYAKEQAERLQTVFLARRTYAGSAMIWLTDAEDSICTFDSDPEYMREFLRIVHEWQMATLDFVLDAGVDMVTRFGYYDIPDFWGLKYFDRYLRPLMDAEADVVHQAGALLSQQQSKGLTQLVDLYRTMGVDLLRDIDPVQGEEDMALLKRELGGSKTLMGGINCDVLLASASDDEIDELVRTTMELMAPGGRFILHPVPGVYAGVPWDRILRMVDAWKRWA